LKHFLHIVIFALCFSLLPGILHSADNTPLTVRQIEIHGAASFSDREIIAWSELEIGEQVDVLELANAMGRIVDEYYAKGYYFASIDSVRQNIIDQADPTSISLEIFLTENYRVNWDKITVTDSLPREYETDYLEGKEFNPLTFENAVDDIIADTENEGYPFTLISLDSLDLVQSEGANRLSAAIGIKRGPLVELSGVEVRGNKATREKYIIRQTRLKSGELYSGDSFKRARKYLQNTGLFKTVEPLGIIRRKDNFYALVNITEKRHNSLDGALGYIPDADGGKGFWTGLVDIKFNNLFGTGRKFQIYWEQPDKNYQDIELSYREPWIGGIPLDLEGKLSQSIRTSAGYDVLGGENEFVTRNAELNGYFPYNEYIEVTGGITHHEVLPDSLSRYVDGIPHSLSFGLQAGFTIDYRDDRLNPTHGIYYNTVGKFTDKKNYPGGNPDLPDKVQEQRAEVNLEILSPVSRQNVLSAFIGGRHIQSEQDNLPVSELYFLGGATTVRGYREEQFPGNSILWTRLEYRILTGGDSRIFAFNDWGYYQRKYTELNGNSAMLEEWKYGYGVGLRIDTYFGLIGVDYGIGEGDSPLEGKLHFRLRNEF